MMHSVRAGFAVSLLVLGGQPCSAQSTSTGIIVSQKGLVVTSYQAVENATKIEILTPSGVRFSDAALVVADSANNLAVLQVQGPPADIATLGNPRLRIAETAIRLGDGCSTFGYPG